MFSPFYTKADKARYALAGRKRKRKPSRSTLPRGVVNRKTELKFFDTADGPEQISLTGEIFENSANLILQGDGANERVGDVIFVHDIWADFVLRLPGTTTETSQADLMKLVIYMDKRTNGAAPALADLFDVVPGGNIGFLSHRNVQKQNRFRILHESVHSMNPTAGGSDGTAATININTFKHVKVRLHFNSPLRIDYDDGTAAIGVVNGNNVGVYACNHIGVITLSSNIRLRYTD